MFPDKISQSRKRGTVPIHGVKAFDGNPRAAPATLPPPADYFPFECLDLIMRHGDHLRLAGGDTIMDAGMDQGVVKDEVFPQRQCGEQRDIGGKTAAEIDCFFSPEQPRCFRFQRLMFAVVAAQQPRAAGPCRHAPSDGIGKCLLQPG
ncbi:hypothetical protein D3C72_1260770 [compost metagenome]